MTTDTPSPSDVLERDPRRWAVLGVVCLGLFLVVVDNTIVNVALPRLAGELNASIRGLQWIVDSYVLAFAALLLPFGALSDRYGRKGSMLVGLAIVAVTSVVAGGADSTGALIALRAVMGVGAAFVMPATLSILTNTFTDPRERAMAIGIWSGVSGLAVALGPLTGGYLIEHFHWGAVFLVNVPIAIVAMIATAIIVPRSRELESHPIDWPGAALSATGFLLLVLGVIEAPAWGWGSPSTLAAIAGGLVVLAAFVAWEARATHPLIDLPLFRNARFSAGAATIALVFTALFGFIFLATQYLQGVLGYSALQAGIRTLPFAGAVGVMAPVAARAAGRLGAKRVVTTGMLLMGAGLTVAATTSAGDTYGRVVLVMLLAGTGMGLAMAPSTEAIMGSLPAAKAGVGSAMNDTTREVGGALGVAIAGSVAASVFSDRIGPVLALVPEQFRDTVSGSLTGALTVARIGNAPELAEAARAAFVDAFARGAAVAAGAAFLGALVAAVALPARAATPAEAAVEAPVATSTSVP